MIGTLYRYPHPFDPSVFLYAGQTSKAVKRDRQHRLGKSSFGRRFRESFPDIELPQPIREEVEVQDYLELNEFETIWMFQYHTWYGYGGMNLILPGSKDYNKMGKLGSRECARKHLGLSVLTFEELSEAGKRGGQTHIDSGHIYKLGYSQGPKNVESGLLARIRTPEHQAAAAKKAGQKNVESGFIQKLGKEWGRRSAESGQVQQALHTRWHTKRDIFNPECSFCKNPAPTIRPSQCTTIERKDNE